MTMLLDVLREELSVLRERRLRTDRTCEGSPESDKRRDYLIGLGLSGGGVRSACVSLGVLQALAKHEMLKHFDYLSTVSGGGYIGAALALRYAQKALGSSDPDEAFPYDDEKMGETEHLRHHANYLAPRGVRSFATGFVVVARSLVLNAFIWIVIGGIVLAVLMLLLDEGRQCHILFDYLCTQAPNAFFDWLLVLAAGLGVGLLAGMVGLSLSSWWVKGHKQSRGAWWGKHVLLPAVVTVLLAICYAVLQLDEIKGHHVVYLVFPVGLLLAIVVPFLGPNFPRWFLLLLLGMVTMISVYNGSKSHALWALAIISGVAAAVVLWKTITANNNPGTIPEPVAGETNEFTNQIASHKYMRRRFLDSWSGTLVVIALACGVVGLVPMIGPLLVAWFGKETTAADMAADMAAHMTADTSIISLITYMGAAASALYGYYQTHLRKTLGLGTAFVIVVGSVLLCFATLVFAHQAALGLVNVYHQNSPWTLDWWPQGVLLAAAIAAPALGFFVNVNDVSLARFYRDRLMEAFMPNLRQGVGDAVEVGHDQPASTADRYQLSAIAHDRPLLGPYPLINTCVLARRSPDFRQRRRGGANFVLSPRYCGSEVTGWKRTNEVLDDQLTVPTAMAMSGAAINPGGGLAGQGVNTNYGVAVAMSLLGLRLGYRFRWHKKSVAHVARRFLNPFGNHFIPGATEIAAELLGIRSHNPTFIELSDGGHFENLGLYELIRRRCGLIVIVDGGEEPGASYAAFISAMTLIGEDFGATIELDRGMTNAEGKFVRATPADIVARSVDDEYPRAAEFASRGYFLASIRYAASDEVATEAAWPKTALLIYLKSAMIKSLPISVRGYKGANPDFPFQSTVDQFFSPEQFEAYRQVGIKIAEQMLDETRLGELFAAEEVRPTFGDLTGSFIEPPGD